MWFSVRLAPSPRSRRMIAIWSSGGDPSEIAPCRGPGARATVDSKTRASSIADGSGEPRTARSPGPREERIMPSLYS